MASLGMSVDLLSGVEWRCCSTAPGVAEDPSVLERVGVRWMAARVPGTAAAAVRGRSDVMEEALATDYDAADWWFCCDFDSDGDGPWVLELAELATVADVWLNGTRILQSRNMFRRHRLDIEQLERSNCLAIRFAALAPLLTQRRPRPRWRTALVSQQSLRWWRTSLLGRMPSSVGFPAIVGPVGSVRLHSRNPVEVLQQQVFPRVEGCDGVVDVSVTLALAAAVEPAPATIRVGDVVVDGSIQRGRSEGRTTVTLRAQALVHDAKLWWPHTHGAQNLYDLTAMVGGHLVDLGYVGFRTIVLDRSGDGFSLSVNGVPIFCRGACWVPVDPIALDSDTRAIATTLRQMRDGGMNMVRVAGTTRYECESFWRHCDELGILVWQDAMLATLDPPDSEEFLSELTAELIDQFTLMQGRPSLAIVSGGSETEQQAAFFGLPEERRDIVAISRTVPGVAQRLLPGVPYVTSSPSGGPLPTHVDSGVAHYFGIGAYRRPLSDARLSGLRFAAECLAFATPPERTTVAEAFGAARVAGHHPRWKQAVPRDAGTPWDFEDVRDFYVREIFGVDAAAIRFDDPERALDLGRAAVAHAMGTAFTEWRRPGSSCAGGLVLWLRDVVAGAGWGLIDSNGRPKAPWYVLRRVCAPVALLCSDEGLNGLVVHVVNDRGQRLSGELQMTAFTASGAKAVEVKNDVNVPPHAAISISADVMVGAFRDLNYAYRFGPPVVDCVRFAIIDSAGDEVAESIHLPLGQQRGVQPDIGLTATVAKDASGHPTLAITTRDLAQWVSIDLPGWQPRDSWFHLPPGASRKIALAPEVLDPPEPVGYVRALNARLEASVRLDG